MIVVVVAVVVLVIRATAARSGMGGVTPRRLAPRPRRSPQRAVAPDDDPDFLRELERRTRRDDRE
jgi:hypothetical protein